LSICEKLTALPLWHQGKMFRCCCHDKPEGWFRLPW